MKTIIDNIIQNLEKVKTLIDENEKYPSQITNVIMELSSLSCGLLISLNEPKPTYIEKNERRFYSC